MGFIKKHKIEVFVASFIMIVFGFALGCLYTGMTAGNNQMAKMRYEQQFEDGRPGGRMPGRGDRGPDFDNGGSNQPDDRMGPGAGEFPGNGTRPDDSTKNEQPDNSTKEEDSTKENDSTENNVEDTAQPNKDKTADQTV